MRIVHFLRTHGEYIGFALAIVLIAGLWRATLAQSQLTAQNVLLQNYYAFPSGVMDQCRSRAFFDYNDGRYWVDGNAVSRFNTLIIDHTLWLPGRVRGWSNKYFIDFSRTWVDTSWLSHVQAYLHSIYTTGQIFMWGNPPTEPNQGNHVWDIAESMPCVDVESGDVVTISAVEDNGWLVKTSRRFDPAVAGVISTQPAFTLGGESAQRRPLALAGIVPCKVTTENGPIQRGDVLVSSSTPGHAMRANSRDIEPGMAVGKALEPWTEGCGKINILVNN
ncbi:MAG: hypothetical protein NC924_01435 [Candidatus Omnitrophica bacterium]|nr:hypothetical protein [Candidatus Omnitrophota bacterium]